MPPPLIPTFENDVAAEASQPVQANPAAFARVGEAMEEGGHQISDEAAQFTQKLIEARQATAATNAVTGLGTQLDDIQHKWSLVPDRASALAGYKTDVANLQKQGVDTIANPFVRAHVNEQFGMEALARRDEVGRQSFALESSKQRGGVLENLQTLSTQAARAPNDQARAVITDNAMAAIGGAEKGGWIAPEEATQYRIKWASDVQAVHVRDQMASAYDKGDTDAMDKLATRVLDPANYPGMTQDTRVGLANELSTKAYRLELRLAREGAHNDALADRAFHQAQAHNEATLLARIDAGQGVPSDLDIETMADRNQISAGGVEALHTAKNREDDGRDDPLTAAHLWDSIGKGEATPNDAYTLYKTGHISKSTLIDGVKAIDAKNTKGDSAADKGNYAVLKTALSGSAIEAGNIFGDKSQAAAQWAQAQGEWNRRVVIGGEDSTGVLSDMVPRYTTSIPKPTWLAPTQYGTPASTKDVMTAAAHLAGDLRARKISPSEFQAQGDLLNDYRRFYAQEDRRAAAAAQVRGRARTTGSGSNSGGGAHLVGVTPGGEP